MPQFYNSLKSQPTNAADAEASFTIYANMPLALYRARETTKVTLCVAKTHLQKKRVKSLRSV